MSTHGSRPFTGVGRQGGRGWWPGWLSSASPASRLSTSGPRLPEGASQGGGEGVPCSLSACDSYPLGLGRWPPLPPARGLTCRRLRLSLPSPSVQQEPKRSSGPALGGLRPCCSESWERTRHQATAAAQSPPDDPRRFPVLWSPPSGRCRGRPSRAPLVTRITGLFLAA